MANDNVWIEIKKIFNKSESAIEIYESDLKNGNYAIEKLQITTNSVLGSVIYNSSGIKIDNWIRVLGSLGKEKRRDIITWNEIDDSGKANRIRGALIVADDILGGIYAMNFGKFEEKIGEIWYFAPDTLEWENLNLQYSDFISWIASGNTYQFYEDIRWKDWSNYCKSIKFDEGIIIYPFLWSNECNIENASKKNISMIELYQINKENRITIYGS